MTIEINGERYFPTAELRFVWGYLDPAFGDVNPLRVLQQRWTPVCRGGYPVLAAINLAAVITCAVYLTVEEAQ